MHSHRLVALFLSVLPAARPHAILTIPAGRPQSNPQGVKLTPFDGARDVANRGCGASQGLATSVIPPTQAFTMGTPIQVQWRLTIPHPADNLDTGIRISIHYGPDASFACNILAGGLVGDPDFEESQQFGGLHPHLSAGPANAQANDLVSTIIQLPNKTCDYCVLQWAWAARVRCEPRACEPAAHETRRTRDAPRTRRAHAHPHPRTFVADRSPHPLLPSP